MCLVEEWDEAERELDRIPRKDGPVAKHNDQVRAQIYIGQKRYELAYNFAAVDPELGPFAALACAYMGEFEKAHAALYLSKKTPGSGYLSAYAKVLLLEGRYQEAVAAYDRCLDIVATGKVLEGMAEALEGLGDFEEAAYFWKRAVSSTAFLSQTQLVGFERCLLACGEVEEARKAHDAIEDLRSKEAAENA